MARVHIHIAVEDLACNIDFEQRTGRRVQLLRAGLLALLQR